MVSGPPTLLVGTFSTQCSECGRGASWHDETHERCLGYGDQPPGCGVRWTHITSTYLSAGIDEHLASERPDLILIPVGA